MDRKELPEDSDPLLRKFFLMSGGPDHDLGYLATAIQEAITTSSPVKREDLVFAKDIRRVQESAFYGGTCKTKQLFLTTGEDCDCQERWSEFSDSREEEEDLSKRSYHYAIIHRQKRFSGSISWQTHSICVQSPRLKAELRKILAGYPGLQLNADKLNFIPPFRPFIHRWPQILASTNEQKDSATKTEMELLIEALKLTLHDDMVKAEKCQQTGTVAWNDLWLIFVPGEMLYCKTEDVERLYRLKAIDGPYVDAEDSDGPQYWYLSMEWTDWNGENFGYQEMTHRIFSYDGLQPIAKLSVCPLAFVPNKEDIKERLLVRGRKFEQMRGYHYKLYKGQRHLRDWDRMVRDNPRNISKPTSGRVIIDALAYHKFAYGTNSFLHPLSSPDGEPATSGATSSPGLTADGKPRVERIEALSDDQCLISDTRAKGYDLKDNEWCEFNIDDIQEFEWNDGAFDRLVMPDREKKILRAFALRTHFQTAEFDDFISSKGRGVIILLCGPPGVGKTLAAESLAELSHVPLYSISASNMGNHIFEKEKLLKEAFECCQMWKAVCLIDEADVFLQARSTSNMAQNEIVSIFLRRLEYYQGVLFLTSNRYDNIDPAFRSRTDFILPFKTLNNDSARLIWKAFLKDMSGGQANVGEDELSELATWSLNGREIKNMVKTGNVLAASEDENLNMGHLRVLYEIRERMKPHGPPIKPNKPSRLRSSACNGPA